MLLALSLFVRVILVRRIRKASSGRADYYQCKPDPEVLSHRVCGFTKGVGILADQNPMKYGALGRLKWSYRAESVSQIVVEHDKDSTRSIGPREART